MLAPSRVAKGGRIKRVEPSTMVGGLLADIILGPALADCLPMPTSSSDHAISTLASAFTILQS